MSHLPRGLRITKRGYVQVRLMVRGRYYHKHFGKDSPLARELAQIHLSEKRKEILMGMFGITRELPSKRFAEVAAIFFDKWSQEKDAEGRLTHGGAKEAGRVIDVQLIPCFGKRLFDEIRPVDVLRWRSKRLERVLGTSVNREQAILSSIFSHIKDWIETEQITPFKLPVDPQTGKTWNPCASVEKAPNRKRDRVLSLTELKALKESCYALQDPDLWEICEMALKSLLRKKDLFNLESGASISTIQAKTQRAIALPIYVRKPLNYFNFRKRWEAARRGARLEDCQFRDLRKTGANLLKSKNWSNKIISEVLGHASTDTTEIYMVKDLEHLKKPMQDLDEIIKGL